MFVNDYYNQKGDSIFFTKQQASDFAKEIADDFNPIHDADAKRFCVPGDLLFSVVLAKFGLSENIQVKFGGMVGDQVPVHFNDQDPDHIIAEDNNGKQFLTVDRSGDRSQDPHLIEQLVRNYVAFSGKAFPHILVPIMRDKQAMINTKRPLVMYESMSLTLDRLDIKDPQLELANANLEVEGKRGRATIEFNVLIDGKVTGTGTKIMAMSSLRPYEQQAIDELIEFYDGLKQSYHQQK